MDPISLSASVAGFLSLAIELTKLISTFIGDVKSAPQEASDLHTEIAALSLVLEKLTNILWSDSPDDGEEIGEQSILVLVISACQSHVAAIYKKLSKLRTSDKMKESMGRIVWPFQRTSVNKLFRLYIDTFRRFRLCLSLPISMFRHVLCHKPLM
jgi:hypothetical protein